MGENSAKRMRGGEMDDVIFGGSSTRPARNIAEVALHLDNTGRDAPGHYKEYDEIEVARGIERGAGSAYRINGREVRARDVQLLFADQASGAHSTALVSTGGIGAIINAKPIERRGLLEEAAGIAGLHSRRHEAELRLKGAETNLSRLDDVLGTLQTQLDALRKQARQAQRYRRLSEHIRRAEAVLLHVSWQAATAELPAASARLAAAEPTVADHTAAALAARRAREAAADEARRAALQKQQQEATERRSRLTQRQEEIARQRAALEAEAIAAALIDEAAAAVRAAETEVERSRAASDAAEQALRTAQTAELAARELAQVAEAKRTKLRAEIQALTELLAAASDKRWTPVLDSVRVDPGYEAALGAALGEDLTAPLDSEAPTHWRALPAYAYALALPGGAVPLAAHVTAPPALQRRLAHIGIVAAAAAAERLQSSLVPGQRLVPPHRGLWRLDSFRRTVGTPTAAGQRLRQRNRLVELGEALRTVEAEATARAAESAEGQRVARQAAEAERPQRQAIPDALVALGRAHAHDAQLRKQAAATASRLAALAESAERLAPHPAGSQAPGAPAARGPPA